MNGDMCIGGGTSASAAVAFLGMWAVMMIPMMLPAVAPVLWRHRGDPPRLLAIAGLAYFAVWSAAGFAVFPLAATGVRIFGDPIAAGIVVILAGSVQFTAWKRRRLACCTRARARPATPAAAWHDGQRLGAECMACCGNLMAVLLVIGMMNPIAMAAVTVAIAVERLAPRTAPVIGAIVVVAGALTIYAG